MANPQIENGHTDIANELAEAFYRLQCSGNQWRLLWVIIRQTYGYKKKKDWLALNYFQKKTNLDKALICRELKDLVNRNILVKHKEGQKVLYGLQKNYEKWALTKKSIVERNKQIKRSIRALTKKSTLTSKSIEPLTSKSPTKESITKEKNLIVVFNYWNDKKIISHRKLTKQKSAINAALENNYSVDEIKKAIDNYHKILNSRDYWFSYRWELKHFLQRGLDRFLDENKPFESFKKRDKVDQPQLGEL